MEGEVTVGDVGRNEGLQKNIGKEGAQSDVGFHLVADSLNGPTNRLNVVPGNGKRIYDDTPNLNQGAYKIFENKIRNEVNAGKKVEIEVELEYHPGNNSNRPTIVAYALRSIII